MTDLKPCPFCGSPATIEYWSKGMGMGESYGYKIGCPVCYYWMMSTGTTDETKLRLIEKWNRRVDE